MRKHLLVNPCFAVNIFFEKPEQVVFSVILSRC